MLDIYDNIWYNGIASITEPRRSGPPAGGAPDGAQTKAIPIRGSAAERGSGRMTAPFAAATTDRRRLFHPIRHYRRINHPDRARRLSVGRRSRQSRGQSGDPGAKRVNSFICFTLSPRLASWEAPSTITSRWWSSSGWPVDSPAKVTVASPPAAV